MNTSINRQQEILNWLKKSRYAKSFKSGKKGFYVLRGHRVRLKDGSKRELLDWLIDQNFTHWGSVCGYNVVLTGPESGYIEKLSFFEIGEIIIDVPFALEKQTESSL